MTGVAMESVRFVDSFLYSRWQPKLTILRELFSSERFLKISFHGSIFLGGCLLFYAGYYLGKRQNTRRLNLKCKTEVLKEELESPQANLERSTSCSSLTTVDGYEKENSPVGDTYRLALIVRKDCGLRRGQTIIHCCRAFLGEFKKLYKDKNPHLREWEKDGQTVVVLRAANEEELQAVRAKSKSLEVPSHFFCEKQSDGSSMRTVMALGPEKSTIIRNLTQHLYRL